MRSPFFGRNPATTEKIYTTEQIEFMMAMERYKRENNRPFPTCCEVLDVLTSLGYRKDAAKSARTA